MTAPLSQDLRRRLAAAVEGGSTARAAARRFEVSASTAVKLMQRVRATGSTEPARIGGYRKPILAPHADLLRKLTATRKDITLAELKEELASRGIAASKSAIWTMLGRLGLTHKKSR